MSMVPWHCTFKEGLFRSVHRGCSGAHTVKEGLSRSVHHGCTGTIFLEKKIHFRFQVQYMTVFTHRHCFSAGVWGDSKRVIYFPWIFRQCSLNSGSHKKVCRCFRDSQWRHGFFFFLLLRIVSCNAVNPYARRGSGGCSGKNWKHGKCEGLIPYARGGGGAAGGSGA